MLRVAKKQLDEDEYDVAVEEALFTFQHLVQLYLVGEITLSVLRARFQEALRFHYARLMLLALEDNDPTEDQLDILNAKIEAQELLLEGFLADIAVGAMSVDRALWRAGMYAPARDAYIAFTVPSAVVMLMPGLPGEICLGDGLCGCYLDIQIDDNNTTYVYWIVDPLKESCEVCLEMEGLSPFVFNATRIANA